MAARTQDPGELGDRRADIGKVGQRQRAYDDIDVVVGYGKLV
jgi:hypothetical protein